MLRMIILTGVLVGLSGYVPKAASAAVIYATGQNNGDPTHSTGTFFYSIDILTGKATPISAISGSPPAGLAVAPDGTLMGFSAGRIVTINPQAGTWTGSGSASSVSVTGLDVTGDGRAFGIPVSGVDRRLHQFDLTTNQATPLGATNAIGASLDTFFGEPSGTNQPFVIGLGSVGTGASAMLYGVTLGTGRNQLLAIDPATGDSSVMGGVNSVGTSGTGPGTWSGFAAMTGVDTDADGVYDSVFGGVNFYDPDGPTGPLTSQRMGGVARYDLTNGTWSMVGTNPGLIFFGFGSAVAVPEPSSLWLLAGGLCCAAMRIRGRHR